MLSPERLGDLESLLIELNRAAAAVILPLFRADHGLENKNAGKAAAGFDPVTRADKGAEAAIRALLGERAADHGVIGEEYGEDRPEADFVWVLDPIDGTRAFVAGLPVWTTLIALRFEGRPVLGGIGQPYLDELFVGHAGGSRLLGRGASRSLRARGGVALDQAIVATTDPDGCLDAREAAAWRALRGAARLARMGCDAYAYAMVAAGRIDVVIEAGLKAWDIDAALPVLAGAGAAASDWRGRPIGAHGGQVVLAGDEAMLAQVLPILEGAAR